MQPDAEHAGGEQAGIIDAHGVHPAVAERNVAVPAGLGLSSRAAEARHRPPMWKATCGA
jgi:hypothetical protein